MSSNKIYFSDFFNIDSRLLEEYGAFNVSLVNDLPLFIDPFLIFCNEETECQEMHDEIIKYLIYLRDRAAVEEFPSDGVLKYYYCFPEVKQNYLGFCKKGNSGSGLGLDFGRALHSGLTEVFKNFGEEIVSKGKHIEKVCLLKEGIGRDNISDFITNLIKPYLLKYTEEFAKSYLSSTYCKIFKVDKVSFDYDRGVWLPKEYYLPAFNNDYVLLTPANLLVRDEIWINRTDMLNNFERFSIAIPDEVLRMQVNEYFIQVLGEDKPTKKNRENAATETIRRFPVLIDHYIRNQEDREKEALARSLSDVHGVKQVFIEQLLDLIDQLVSDTDFYSVKAKTSYEEAMERVLYLKHVIENCDGYRYFYDGDKPIHRESDLHIMYRLACCNTISDTNAEVNNGRGPVDFKLSQGSKDATLVEFKMARTLKRNLEKQVDVYKNANGNPPAIKAIVFFTDEEMEKVYKILNDLGLTGKPGIVVIDARKNNKIQASKA